MAYIGAFGCGTVAAMTVFAAAAGRLGSVSENPVTYRAVMASAAVVAMLVGGWWLVIGAS
jgi:hypothetical protein